MGDSSGEVTEESRDASQEEKGQAMEAMSEGSALCIVVYPCASLHQLSVPLFSNMKVLILGRETGRGRWASNQGCTTESNLGNHIRYQRYKWCDCRLCILSSCCCTETFDEDSIRLDYVRVYIHDWIHYPVHFTQGQRFIRLGFTWLWSDV
jgi:hypothetical protein